MKIFIQIMEGVSLGLIFFICILYMPVAIILNTNYELFGETALLAYLSYHLNKIANFIIEQTANLNPNKLNIIEFFMNRDIIEANILMAKFDGWKLRLNEKDNFYKPDNLGNWANFGAHEFKYHTSWDWLMPVVEKNKIT